MKQTGSLHKASKLDLGLPLQLVLLQGFLFQLNWVNFNLEPLSSLPPPLMEGSQP